MKLHFTGEIQELMDGITLQSHEMNYQLASDGVEISVKKSSILSVSYDGEKVQIEYKQRIHFFRALSLLLQNINFLKPFHITEEIHFDTNGIMFDVSRNAVLKIDTMKYYLRKMALMGLNMAMLYTEDTYEVTKYPFLGYMRGRYTEIQLRELDDYADKFGIELIPCIQTLAHLQSTLRWEQMTQFRDTSDILLCGEEKTYDLIEAMIVAASKPYRSKRIHIGMDEASSIGLGNYLKINGYVNGFSIFNDHLKRVVEITQKYNLRPMMWSDMYFKLASDSKSYYDKAELVPQEVIDLVPPEIELVYWDYYHEHEQEYEFFINKHMQFNNSMLFASGLWSWIAPAMHNGEAFARTIPGMIQCKKSGVREIFTTLWEDDGSEADFCSALFAMQMCAEFGYGDSPSFLDIKNRFACCTGESAESFLLISKLDSLNEHESDAFPSTEESNFSKYLLYQDPLVGLFEEDIKGVDFTAHFAALVPDFETAARQSPQFSLLFENYAALADLLADKAELGGKLIGAYRNNDIPTLNTLANEIIPRLLDKVQLYRQKRAELWYQNNKPFGFEIIDIRLGGVFARIQTARSRICDYLNHRVETLDELEEPRFAFISYTDNTGARKYNSVNDWQRIISACPI